MHEPRRLYFVYLSCWPLRLLFGDFLLLIDLEVESVILSDVACKRNHHRVSRFKSKLICKRYIDGLIGWFLNSLNLF